jgi:DNA ligase (NAD+)
MSGTNHKLAEQFARLSEIMIKNGDNVRSRVYSRAEEIILGFPTEIKSVDDLQGIQGIGPQITNKIKEYLDSGKISLIEREENKPIMILTNVYGIGAKKAHELIEKGVTTIDQLREKQDELLNNVQKIGVKYYDDILKRIPRDEIDKYSTFFEKTVKNNDMDSTMRFEIVGSYRRGNLTSGDIDVIITSKNPEDFTKFLDSLLFQNIIIEILSRGKSKCLVIARLPDGCAARRVDFLYCTPEEYPFSVLYFTGSKAFNVVMRSHALKKGYSLNEHGFKDVEELFPDEKSIFDFLGLKYIVPEERVDGRKVIPLEIIHELPKEFGKSEFLGETEEKESIEKSPKIESLGTISLLSKKKMSKQEKLLEKEKKKTEKLRERELKKLEKENRKTKKLRETDFPKIESLGEKEESQKESIETSPKIESLGIISLLSNKKMSKQEKLLEKEKKKTQKLREKELKKLEKENRKTKKLNEKLEGKKLEEKNSEKSFPKKKEITRKSPKIKSLESIPPIFENSKEKENLEKMEERKEEKKKSIKKNTTKKNIKNISQIIETNIDSMKTNTKNLLENFQKNGITTLENLTESELVEMIRFCNDAYYNKSEIITDNEFDILKEFTQHKYPNNETISEIGAPISGKSKVKLPYEMASMDKIKPDSNSLSTWMKKYSGSYVLSCKLDGISGMYVSENGKQNLYTRGNGTVGQDITHLIKPLHLPKIEGYAIRGEFILTKQVFDTKYKSEFANARNLVAGIINKKTVDTKAKDLHFVAYEIIHPEIPPSLQMETLKKLGFEVVQNKTVNHLSNEMLSELLVDWRESYEYVIDGIIVTDDKIYPRTSGNPEHSFAFKMVLSDQVAEAKVVDVLWTPSKNGYLKPRVRIEPISLGGVTIEYATGFNGKFIQDNNIGIGAIITIIRSGDVIPHIKSVTVPATTAKMPNVPYVWTDTHVDIVLENVSEDETVQEKMVTAFFVHLEVDGLSKGNVKRLFKEGFNTVPKILKMYISDFEKIEGFKTKMAEKLFHSINEKVKKASLLDIMVASNKLGRGLGERKIKPILEMYPDILVSTDSANTKIENLKKVAGIGNENAVSFVQNIEEFMEFLKECDLENKLQGTILEKPVEVVITEENKSHPLYQKKIVMTKVRDKEIIDSLTKFGASLVDSVKKDTFVLIVKDKNDTSNKIENAKKLGITIMTPDEFKSVFF